MASKANFEYSIIVPTFNRLELLKKAINSALIQSYKNYEIIIIDNYSSDNTENYIRKLQKEFNFIKYLKFNNKGIIGSARNQGAKEASGKYLCFLDSDDEWFANKLEEVNKVIRNKKVKFLYHDLKLTSDNLKSFFRRKIRGKKYYSKFFLEPLLNGNKINTSSVVIDRNIFISEGGFDTDPKLVCCECVDLWIKIIKKTDKIYYLNKTLGNYLLHNDNISNTRFYIPFTNVCAKYNKIITYKQKKRLNSRRIYIGKLFRLKKFFIYAILNGNSEIKIKILIKYILSWSSKIVQN